jgi:hypothetical protein
VKRKRRRCGVEVRGFLASRDSAGCLRIPRRCGRRSLGRLLLLLFPPSSPPPPVHDSVDGDETPRRLGLGA